jgi:hypothetical protein
MSTVKILILCQDTMRQMKTGDDVLAAYFVAGVNTQRMYHKTLGK